MSFIFKARLFDFSYEKDGVVLSIYSLFSLFLTKNSDYFIINNFFGATGIILSFILAKLITKKDFNALLTAIMVSTLPIYLKFSNCAYNVIIAFNFMLITMIAAIIFQKKQKFNVLVIISSILMISIRPDLGLITIPLFVIGFRKAKQKSIYFLQWFFIFGSFLLFNFIKLYRSYNEFDVVNDIFANTLSNIVSNLSLFHLVVYGIVPAYSLLGLSFYFTRNIKYMDVLNYSILILFLFYFTQIIRPWYLLPASLFLPMIIFAIMKRLNNAKINMRFLVGLMIICSIFSVIYINESYTNTDLISADNIYYTFSGDIADLVFDNNSVVLVPFTFNYTQKIKTNQTIIYKLFYSTPLIQNKTIDFKIIDIKKSDNTTSLFNNTSFVEYFDNQILQNNKINLFFVGAGFTIIDYPVIDLEKKELYPLLNYTVSEKAIINISLLGNTRVIYEINAKNKTQEPMMYTITGKNISSYWTIKELIINSFT